ncbi:MAG: hypothetical protein Tsb0017_17010 [Geothermobacteraceae bacterium]
MLITLGVMAILAAFMFPSFWNFQRQGLAEISKNDLLDRAERIKSFVADEIKMAGYMVGRNFSTPLTIGANTYQTSIAVSNSDNGDDQITIIKGESAFPPLFVNNYNSASVPPTVRICVADDSLSGSDSDKRATLGLRAGTVYDLVSFGNQKRVYRLYDDANEGVNIGGTFAAKSNPAPNPPAGTCEETYDTRLVTLSLQETLRDDVPQGTEVFPVRARQISIVASGGENQLRLSDQNQNEIIDRQVDGLQFQYLVNGNWVDDPVAAGAGTEDIRAVRFYLLVRSLAVDKDRTDTTDYSPQMGPNVAANTYGPYNDNFRRVVVVGEVEVKNYVTK